MSNIQNPRNIQKGLCIIIIYYDFTNIPGFENEDRLNKAARYEESTYKDLFAKFNFDVKIIDRKELLGKDILQILDDNISSQSIRLFNCFKPNGSQSEASLNEYAAISIVISTHGDIQGVICSNRKYVKYKTIIEKLNNYAVWKDKPKLILFESCRSANSLWSTIWSMIRSKIT